MKKDNYWCAVQAVQKLFLRSIRKIGELQSLNRQMFFFSSSDLANGNILSSQVATIEISDKARLYPNPVQSNVFTIQFGKLNSGDYTISLTDQMGRQVHQQKININSQYQAVSIHLPAFANGVLLVRLLDQKGKAVLSKKLIVLGYQPFQTRF